MSVWIPLHGAGPQSTLEVLPGSHTGGASIQEACATADVDPIGLTHSHVESLGKTTGVDSGVERIPARPGEAVVFDGRLWHASVNESRSTRRALLLQYAAPDTQLLVPHPGSYAWPFTGDGTRGRCLLVSGTDEYGVNDVVPPPSRLFQRSPRLRARIEALGVDNQTGNAWRVAIKFAGPTATGLQMTSHVSTLAYGHTPHPPHTHQEEEVLVVLRGELTVHLPGEGDTADRVERLGPGGVLHYPLDQLHTITGASEAPAIYVMLKWCSHRISKHRDILETQLVNRVDPVARDGKLAFLQLFRGPTRYLRTLECHRSSVPPGGGYKPHADAYDVAIITLDGTIETLGQRVGPESLIWYPMGSRHGLHNVGDCDSHYVVFEFHGPNVGSLVNPYRFSAAAHRIVRLPVRVVRRAIRLLHSRPSCPPA